METQLTIEYQVSALNDLIRINSDRITGYKKCLDLGLYDDLDELFTEFIYQGRQNINELTTCIYKLGGKLADGAVLPGKFYHAWIRFKSALLNPGKGAMLGYCENSEDVAKCAYQKILNDRELTQQAEDHLVHYLKRQSDAFRVSHQLVKTLCDKFNCAS